MLRSEPQHRLRPDPADVTEPEPPRAAVVDSAVRVEPSKGLPHVGDACQPKPDAIEIFEAVDRTHSPAFVQDVMKVPVQICRGRARQLGFYLLVHRPLGREQLESALRFLPADVSFVVVELAAEQPVHVCLRGLIDELRALETDLANLLAEEDVEHLAAAMEPGSVAGVLVWENKWAAPFASAARRAGGQLVANGRIPIQAILAALEADEASMSEGE